MSDRMRLIVDSLLKASIRQNQEIQGLRETVARLRVSNINHGARLDELERRRVDYRPSAN